MHCLFVYYIEHVMFADCQMSLLIAVCVCGVCVCKPHVMGLEIIGLSTMFPFWVAAQHIWKWAQIGFIELKHATLTSGSGLQHKGYLNLIQVGADS